MGDKMGEMSVGERGWAWLAIVPTAAMALQSWLLLYYKPFATPEGGSKNLTLGDVTNCTLGSRKVLAAYRVAMAVYMLFFTIPQLLDRGTYLLKFYTTWNWYLLVSYFCVAAWLSMVACTGKGSLGAISFRQRAARKQHQRQSTGHQEGPVANLNSPFESVAEDPLEGPPAQTDGQTDILQCRVGFLGRVFVPMLHINLTTVLLVDVITWTILWPMLSKHPDPKMVEFYRGEFFCYESYIQHAANALFIYLDLILNTCPLEPYMLGWASAWSVCYAAWAITYYKRTGIWLYPFLNTSRPMAWAAYLGLFGSHWLAFLLGPMLCGRLVRGQRSTWRQAVEGVGVADIGAARSLQKQASRAAFELSRRTSSLVRALSTEQPPTHGKQHNPRTRQRKTQTPNQPTIAATHGQAHASVRMAEQGPRGPAKSALDVAVTAVGTQAFDRAKEK